MNIIKNIKKASVTFGLSVMPVIMLISVSLFLNSCHSKQANNKQETSICYTCPMHPQIHADKPGKCPVCGMTLEKVTPEPKQEMPPDSALSYLVQPVNEAVVGNYKVISPKELQLHDTINTYGQIGFDERAVHTVSTLVTGRIEKLYVKYAYREIHKGQPLMEIYSPSLLSAQRDLLQAVTNNDVTLITALKERLFNMGMPETEIKRVADSGKILSSMTMYSPYNGIASPLNIRQGMYVNAGQTVFTVQDINLTRAILQVFTGDIGKIRTGDNVLISADADASKTVKGSVSFITPYRNNNEKTTPVNVYLPFAWKIGTLIHGQIIVDNKNSGWTVPATAVTNLGTHAIVWVQNKRHPDIYEKKEVQTGEKINDSVQIISGIKEGDKLVENAAYMVDSDNLIQ